MIVAAHQPCYLPAISFFQKLALADVFVLADDYQFSKHAATNRTRIKTTDGASWLTVPVLTRSRGGQKIRDVEFNCSSKWQEKHWRTLGVNHIYAAYFEQYADALQRIYARPWKRLLDLNLELLEFACKALHLETSISLSSELEVTGGGHEKLLNIISAAGGTDYLAGEELRGYLRPTDFVQRGVQLQYCELESPRYHQQFGPFIADLSILDLLVNEGPDSSSILLSNRAATGSADAVAHRESI